MARGKGGMKCPECGHKLTQANYDPIYQWYDCPGCEGAITYDEILEVSYNEHPATRPHSNSRPVRKRSAGRSVRKSPVAKGKKRKTEIQADEDLQDEHLKFITDNVQASRDSKPRKKKDDVPTREVVNIMADTIQEEIYPTLGGKIDRMNAYDKALNILREITYNGSAVVHGVAVPMKLCREHK